MAVTLITSFTKHIGTNAERVAMDVTGQKAGTQFFETDTAATYILDGGGSWVAYPSTSTDIATVKAAVGAVTDSAVTTVGTTATEISYTKGLLNELAKVSLRTCVKKTVSTVVTANLFTVAGGAVRVLGIAGHITTVIETKANATKLVFTSTGGAAVDMCATLNVTASAVRKLLYITGTKADALALSADEGILVNPLASPLVLVPGVVSLNCADSSTGVIDWYMVYQAMATGASVS